MTTLVIQPVGKLARATRYTGLKMLPEEVKDAAAGADADTVLAWLDADELRDVNDVDGIARRR